MLSIVDAGRSVILRAAALARRARSRVTWRGVRKAAWRWPAIAVAVAVGWTLLYRVTGPPVTTIMVARAFEGQDVRRARVPLSAISPHLVWAVIAAEDSRFCNHRGVDMDAVEQALAEARAGRRLRGASTLSQQTAKNAFLWNGGGFLRKGLEAGFTVLIETFWGKRRILEVYLNSAEWGDGLFGAEAAAQARFGVPAAALGPHEAALLAAVLPNPRTWRVDPPGPYVRGRAATIRARMGVVVGDGLDACVIPR